MGVSLSYWTVDQVDPETKRKILADTNELYSSHDWWSEPIIFFDSWIPAEGGKELAGDTKLFLDGYRKSGGYIEVELDEYELMVRRDAKFILEMLCAWSTKFGLRWILEMADEDFGVIEAGKVSVATTEAFLRNGIDIISPVDEDHARLILLKHASRRDNVAGFQPRA